jgi:hypothetical protein
MVLMLQTLLVHTCVILYKFHMSSYSNSWSIHQLHKKNIHGAYIHIHECYDTTDFYCQTNCIVQSLSGVYWL